MYVCSNFAGPYVLNKQAHKDAIDLPLQGKCTHGDMTYFAYLLGQGSIRVNFHHYKH